MKTPIGSYIGGGVKPDLDNIERDFEMEKELLNFPTFVKSKNEEGK